MTPRLVEAGRPPLRLLLNTIYTYILLLDKLTAHLFSQLELEFCKSIYYLPGKSVAARTSCCSPPVCHLLCGALFSNESAPAFHMRLQKQLKFDHQFLHFFKSHWRAHSSYSFCMPSTCCKSCGPTFSTKKRDVHFPHIFPTNLQCFFVVVVRRHATEATATPSRQS